MTSASTAASARAANPRFVVAAAARPRAMWFSNVSKWANDASLPIDLIPCVGVDELAHNARSRALSAVFVDAGLIGFDRNVLSQFCSHHIPTFVFRDVRNERDWEQLGASAVLDPDSDVSAILTWLTQLADPIRSAEATLAFLPPDPVSSPLRGTLTTVVGSGGSGVSTVSMALAECLAAASKGTRRIVLADFCLRAELGMLHDSRAVTPGLQELLDLHRLGSPDSVQVRDCCFRINKRGYDLLLGLRRRRLWSTLHQAATEASLHSLTAAYDHVVIDTDDDFEGESECGSLDLEERNLLARTAIRHADHIVAVGQASLKGLHSLCRSITDLVDFGVRAEQIHPVLNQAPKNSTTQGAYTQALEDLIGGLTNNGLHKPLFIGFHSVDDAVRNVSPLPHEVVTPLRALLPWLSNTTEQPRVASRFQRITPGFLRSSTMGHT